MSKRVIGERSDSMLARSILRNVADEQVSVQETDCEATVYVSNAYFDFKSRNENFEPYLVLQCHINSVSGDFAGDINEIVFNDDPNNVHPSTAPQCQFEYYPTKDEHCDLVQAGLYDRMDEDDVRLKPGNILFGAVLSLPTKVKVYHVKPLSEEDSPITFVEVENKFNIPIDALSSGYANEEEYAHGRIVGLLGKEYLDPVPVLETEDYAEDEYMGPMDDFSSEDYLQMHTEDESTYEVEQEVPVEDIPLSDEDKAMLDRYVSIQDAADKRLENIENQKAQALAAKQTEAESEESDYDSQEDQSYDYQDDGDIGPSDDDITSEPAPVRQVPDAVSTMVQDSDEDDKGFGED